MWVFGYGSLIWRPNFPFVESRAADLQGYERRFWQGSTDHRGTPEAPGRVVTLLRAPMKIHCRGLAFRIKEDQQASVLDGLDVREKGGYDRFLSPLKTVDGDTLEALVYLANEDNPNWLGPASIDAIAEQIVQSKGPSGPNTEYVLELDAALRAMDTCDEHVHAIAAAVRARLTPK